MHESVLLEEALELLNIRPGGCYLDVTGGAGGHSKAILEKLGPHGKLIITDRDPKAFSLLEKRFHQDQRCSCYEARFSELFEILDREGLKTVDGLLADLGVSSDQLAESERGIGFMAEGPLDMRMDPRLEWTAADILARTREKELADLIFQFGEERLSRRLARAIVKEREVAPIKTTMDLKQIAEKAIGRFYRRQKIHPATRLFQALRLVVNQEQEELAFLLKNLSQLLADGGRAVLISFHSLEDRLVKHKFLDLKKMGWNLITKKPIVPQEEELKRNPRSRSAKLRAIEKPLK